MTKIKITLPLSGGAIAESSDGDGNVCYTSFNVGGGGGGGNAAKSSGGGAVSYGAPPNADKDQKEPDIKEKLNQAAVVPCLMERHQMPTRTRKNRTSKKAPSLLSLPT